MYFELNAKTNMEDFFNYREELKMLFDGIKNERIVVVKGPRRIGKTSLLKVAYNQLEMPKAWIDGFEAEFVSAQELFANRFAELITQVDVKSKISQKISAVYVGSIGFSFKEKGLSSLTKQLNNTLKKAGKFGVIFIDEAQLLKEHKVDYFLAHLYDHAERIKIVLAGSQIGLLEDFIGANAESPLFGRAKTQIQMKRLSTENALSFLLQGFEQAGIKADMEELKDAVNVFGGLVGWLTYYGYYRIRYGHKKAKEMVFRDAKEIIRNELLRFLSKQKGKRKRYLFVLKAIAEGFNSWNEIREFLAIKAKQKVSESRLYLLLEKLKNFGFIEKRNGAYYLSDPMLRLITSAF